MPNQFISSSRVKEIAMLGGDYKNFIPEKIYEFSKTKLMEENDSIRKLNDLKEYLSSSKKMLGKSVIDVERIKEIVYIESSLPLELEQSRVIISQKNRY